jgi:hypothetical protein
MNRENMLNHLAHTLPHWPDEYVDMIEPGHGWAWYDEGEDCTLVLCKGEEEIREADYLQRRTELINKPSWDDAPEWAEWLAQDEDGDWWWYECPIEVDDLDEEEWVEEHGVDGRLVRAASGVAPSGHDWRDTLEPRPQAQSDIKKCKHCGVTFQRPHLDSIPDDRCARCDEEIKALWPEPETTTRWTSKTCTECGRTTAAKAGDDAPVCAECMVLGGVDDGSDPVNHPAHYQSDSGIECIDAIRAALGKEGFIAYCRGNAIKYAWRSDRKGKAAEDKRKAAWYLDRAAKELE